MATKRRPSATRFIDAAERGDTKSVQDLLAKGVNLHAWHCNAIQRAAHKGHADIVSILLANGAHARTRGDLPIAIAVKFNHFAVVKLLAAAIFSPDLWRDKTLADISAEARLISQRIKSSFDPEPELLRQAELILFDYGMTCWEQVRPDPPQIKISPTPAKGNPV
jgi:ankyrin repeat protein